MIKEINREQYKQYVKYVENEMGGITKEIDGHSICVMQTSVGNKAIVQAIYTQCVKGQPVIIRYTVDSEAITKHIEENEATEATETATEATEEPKALPDTTEPKEEPQEPNNDKEIIKQIDYVFLCVKGAIFVMTVYAIILAYFIYVAIRIAFD
jgi:hypothetical protein